MSEEKGKDALARNEHGTKNGSVASAADLQNDMVREACEAAAHNSVRAEEALADVLQHHNGPDTTEAHTRALTDALERFDCTQAAKGSVSLEDIHELLNTELPPQELLRRDVPARYGELQRVVEALNASVQRSRSNVGGFHEAFLMTTRRLQELEQKFIGTQVDIDEMPHAPFHDALRTFDACITISVEEVCEGINAEMCEKIAAYKAVLEQQLHRYEEDAMLVTQTPLCRLSASRLEDDEDPWEIPRDRKKPHFESPQLQAWYDQQERERVAEDYEEEWYAARRKDIDTVVPRAKRVLREVDESDAATCAQLLEDMLALACKKRQVVDSVTVDTRQQSEAYLAEMRESIARVVEAGDEFQRLRREQRERSERDIDRVDTHVAAERSLDEELSERFDAAQSADKVSFEDFALAMDELRLEILERQMKLAELADTRRSLAQQMLQRLEDEQHRRSRFQAAMTACKEYKSLLTRSLDNFRLPAGYNAVLTECLQQAQQIITDVFGRQHEVLDGYLRDSVSLISETSATLYHHLQMQLLRKSAKYNDLYTKSEVSRNQREFCLSTQDPLAALHGSREGETKEMASTLKGAIDSMASRAADLLQQFEDMEPLRQSMSVRVKMSSVVDLPVRVSNTAASFARFIVRAHRAPLTNLDFASDDRLSVPSQYFDDERPFHARTYWATKGNSPVRLRDP